MKTRTTLSAGVSLLPASRPKPHAQTAYVVPHQYERYMVGKKRKVEGLFYLCDHFEPFKSVYRQLSTAMLSPRRLILVTYHNFQMF